MTIERLARLKDYIEHRLIIEDESRCIIVNLIDAEIRRIESRRKVPLVPCRCGNPRPRIVRDTMGDTVKALCLKCGRSSPWRSKKRDAIDNWNESQKGGEQ